MPRPPRFIHPVRRLRKILRLSQAQFAKLVGTSHATVQSVELGRLALSDGLAKRITLATGVEPASINRRNGVPRTLDHLKVFTSSDLRRRGLLGKRIRSGELISPVVRGHIYRARDFGNWHGSEQDSRAEFDDQALQARYSLEAFLDACWERRKWRPAIGAFTQWLGMALDEFGIVETYKRIWADRHIKKA